MHPAIEMKQDDDTGTLVIEIVSEDGVVALVPSGFVYNGFFYGRALSDVGWKRVTIPYSELIVLLR